MASLQLIISPGNEIGLEGKELQEFVKEQQDRERLVRRLEREQRRDDENKKQD